MVARSYGFIDDFFYFEHLLNDSDTKPFDRLTAMSEVEWAQRPKEKMSIN